MNKDLGLLILRIVFGFRLIYGTIDNIISWDQMIEFRNFLDGYGFPFPLVAAIFSVYLQFFSGLAWILGFRLKTASILMIINFIIAIIGVHLARGDNYLAMTAPIHMLAVSIILIFTGGGRYMIGKNN